MELIKNLSQINFSEEKKIQKIYLTIGNFDGVHLGHQVFLRSIFEEAESESKSDVESKASVVVMTFVPHPSFVLKNINSYLINSYEERRELLKSLGVHYLLEVDFNRDFSSLNPEQFLNQFILCHPNVHKIFLGHDFSFGAHKKGNFELVTEFLKDKNVQSASQAEYLVNGLKVSSSEVREKISQGDFSSVSLLLGRNYYLQGMVVRGEGRGKGIGFPTANIAFDKSILPPGRGVYVTKTYYKGMVYFSMTNIGLNPTFKNNSELMSHGSPMSIETHILDFHQDIYGERIKVEFIQKIRDEQKFQSVNELIMQIHKDENFVREFFRNFIN